MLTRTTIFPALALAFACVTNCSNTAVLLAPTGDAATHASLEGVCGRLVDLACDPKYTLAICEAQFDQECKGTTIEKQAAPDCMNSAKWICKAGVPHSDECVAETAAACGLPTDGGVKDAVPDAVPPDAASDGGICGGLCEPGKVKSFDCISGASEIAVSLNTTIAPNNGTTTNGTTICMTNAAKSTIPEAYFFCDNSVRSGGSTSIGSWAYDGTNLSLVYNSKSYTCTPIMP